jgi:hypothetical protein
MQFVNDGKHQYQTFTICTHTIVLDVVNRKIRQHHPVQYWAANTPDDFKGFPSMELEL